ncbi:MAG: TIGR02679 family protein [Ktedonobacteraceae bacterium]|nr:TIGR02679 family protein [Ktedonobacteraceae bacterium]
MDARDAAPDVQRAVVFFRQAGLSRLLEKLRTRYIQLGRVGGLVVLENSTPGERREIASLLGRPVQHEGDLKVKLAAFEAALLRSRFACTLPNLLSAFFPDKPLVTRPEQQAAHAAHQERFRTALNAIATELPEASYGRRWLQQGAHGQDWLFARSKNESDAEQERQLDLARYIASTLNQLPAPGTHERLALFAQRTSGDPHMLDPDRAAGRLFLLALGDLAQDEAVLPAENTPQDRAQALRLYAYAGLLVDTLSSSVAAFNLVGATYLAGRADPLPEAAGPRVLLLPLRQMLAWRSAQPASNAIYIFENPQVFEEVIAGLSQDDNPGAYQAASNGQIALPTLICTSGWPSAAALILLDLLMAQSPANRLHYSGDFDLAGLQIAASLLARYPGRCHPWRFAPDSSLLAIHAEGATASAADLAALATLPDGFAPLITRMQEQGRWAYQEGITHVLLEDVRKPG